MEKNLSRLPLPLAWFHKLDIFIFFWTMRRRHLRVMARCSRGLSRTADGFAYPVVALGLMAVDSDVGTPFAVAMALAFALERPLYWILKNGLKRNRPAAAIPGFNSFIIPSDKFSFPSGHTSGAFLVATLLSLNFPALTAVVFGWALLVGASRVTLGVHFPTDTVAGALMGAGLAWCSHGWLSGQLPL